MSKIKQRLAALALSVITMLSSVPTAPTSAAETEALSTNVTCPFRQDVTFEAGGVSGVTSSSYRIPSMITLKDGTIVAAADIRWDTTYDGGGLDTLVASSDDGGVTWSYTAANYLGDNGNKYDGKNSTCFIDPCLNVDKEGETVYMLVDLYPYGVALNGSGNTAPSKNVGFNDDGYLLLSNNNHGNYSFYLKGNLIYNLYDEPIANYTVDEYFNLYYNGGTNPVGNLFYSDSPYRVVRTGFLYLTSSSDGGKSWSAPKLLNLKSDSEQVCLVGPGRGVTMSDGTMIFPVYSFNGSTDSQRMGFIYSKDGEDWKRVDSSVSWSSEAAVVEVGTGTLRFFYRNGTSRLCYVDYDMTSKRWSSVTTTTFVTNSNTQLSAITYSKTSDGKQVILVSCPTGPNGNGSTSSAIDGRRNGCIFAFTVDPSTNELQYLKTIQVNDNNEYFMYSCLTERSDGSVAILYEGSSNYAMNLKVFSKEDIGISSSDEGGNEGGVTPSPDDPNADYIINLDIGESITVSPSDDENIGTAGSFTSNDGNVTYTVEHLSADSTYKVDTDGINSGNQYLIVTGTNYAVSTSSSSTNDWNTTSLPLSRVYFNGTETNYLWTITETTGGYYIQNPNGQYMTINKYLTGTQSGSNHTVTVSYTPSVCDITPAGNGYMVFANDSLVGLNNAGGDNITALGWETATNTIWTFYQLVNQGGTNVTFTGESITDGTYITIGDVTYKIIVNPAESSKSVFAANGVQKTLDPISDLDIADKGYTVSYTVDQDEDSVITSISNGVITTHDSNSGVAIITATVTDSNGVVIGTVTYTLSVSVVEITETRNLYMSVDHSATLSGLTGDMIDTELDTSIATVTYNNGTLTALGVTEGSTSVIIGTVLVNLYVNPANRDNIDLNVSVRINVDTIEHCTIYYALNGGELHKIESLGMLMQQNYTDGVNIMFFAVPDEGYALTVMGATKSAGQYYTISNGVLNDGSDSDAWPFNSPSQTTIPSSESNSAWKSGHGYINSLIQGNMTISQMRDMFTRAIALGADGTNTFTRNNNSSLDTDLVFKAEKLPTLTKEITKYTRDGVTQDYTEDVKLMFGDVLTYQFTITSTSTNVEFTDIVLDDSIIGYENNLEDDLLNTAGTYTYEATYTIKQADVALYTGGTFVNNAKLTYKYKSNYSSGSYGGNASDSAACEIINLITYAWEEGTPEAIVNNVDGRFTLPDTDYYSGTEAFNTKVYTGETEYVVENGKWVLNEYWGIDWNGVRYYYYKYSVENTIQPAVGSRSFVFYGKWEFIPNDVDLTIKKVGYSEYEEIDPNQTFLFKVTGGGVDLTVAVHGDSHITINGLKVGETYTVTEVTDWSWRYELDSWSFTADGGEAIVGDNNGAEITLGHTANKITFTNTREKDLWLDGDSFIVNIFKQIND